MALRIGAVVVHVSDTERAGGFWREALGLRSDANPDFLEAEGGEAPRLHLDGEDRTHLDLWAESREEQESEVERLLGLGARRVAWNYFEHADFVVLADPGDAHFCVIDTGRSIDP